MNDEAQRALAKELLSQLDTVITDQDERRTAEMEIAAALAVPGEDGSRRLAEVLRARQESRAWMRDRDPDRSDVDRVVELGGPPSEVGTYLVCPHDDYDYVLESVGEGTQFCPVHHVPLIRPE